MEQATSCQCGQVRGQLRQAEQCTRIVCYCDDCRAFLRFLNKPELLDSKGGTDVVVVADPARLTLTDGLDRVRCMSLSEKGMLRWYAGCCNSPIGNTTRSPSGGFVGLTHSFVARTSAELEAAVGPVQMVSHTDGATAPVPASGWRAVRPMLGLGATLIRARLSGNFRKSPFFKADGTPIAARTVLTPEQRAALSN